jgi:hypothetical protein
MKSERLKVAAGPRYTIEAAVYSSPAIHAAMLDHAFTRLDSRSRTESFTHRIRRSLYREK